MNMIVIMNIACFCYIKQSPWNGERTLCLDCHVQAIRPLNLHMFIYENRGPNIPSRMWKFLSNHTFTTKRWKQSVLKWLCSSHAAMKLVHRILNIIFSTRNDAERWKQCVLKWLRSSHAAMKLVHHILNIISSTRNDAERWKQCVLKWLCSRHAAMKLARSYSTN